MSLSETDGKPVHSIKAKLLTFTHAYRDASDRWKAQEICNSAWAKEDKKRI